MEDETRIRSKAHPDCSNPHLLGPGQRGQGNLPQNPPLTDQNPLLLYRRARERFKNSSRPKHPKNASQGVIFSPSQGSGRRTHPPQISHGFLPNINPNKILAGTFISLKIRRLAINRVGCYDGQNTVLLR